MQIQEKIIHKPKIEIKERIIEVPRIQFVEKIVEIPQKQFVEKIIEVFKVCLVGYRVLHRFSLDGGAREDNPRAEDRGC